MFQFRVSEGNIYDYDKGFLYSYNNQCFKLTVCKRVRKPGFELADGCRSFTAKGQAGNEEKLPQNVRRAKSRVFELAMCNTFSHFVTLTFSPEKVQDRENLNELMKRFCKFLNNYNNRHAGGGLSYLLIPEQHKEGGWHLHGLFSGIPEADLRTFSLHEHLPHYIRQKLFRGEQVQSWVPYEQKFGYCVVEPVRSVEGVSKYITKYITKELDKSVRDLNAHMYYHSRNLQGKTLLYSAPDCVLPDPDYSGEYCLIKNGETAEQLLYYFTLEAPAESVEDDFTTEAAANESPETGSLPGWPPVFFPEAEPLPAPALPFQTVFRSGGGS